MTAPAWLPDWKVPANYPPRESLFAWRWEFLRRRADYQAAWAEGKTRFDRVLQDHPSLRRVLTQKKPPRAAVGAWAERQFKAADRAAELAGHEELLRPFALRDFLDPAKHYDADHLSLYFDRPDWGGVLELRPGEVAESYKRGVVIVAFDLRWNLEQQLRDTKRMLLDEQKVLGIPGGGRMHPKRWTAYLRALDAKACGASLSTIAAVLLRRRLSSPDEFAEAKARAHALLDAALTVQTKLTS